MLFELEGPGLSTVNENHGRSSSSLAKLEYWSGVTLYSGNLKWGSSFSDITKLIGGYKAQRQHGCDGDRPWILQETGFPNENEISDITKYQNTALVKVSGTIHQHHFTDQIYAF